MNRTHFIYASVAPRTYRRAVKLPRRFSVAKAGTEPMTSGEDYRIMVCALVDALTPSDAMARFDRVYPQAAIRFCSPKEAGFQPAGYLHWQHPEPN